ncbi:FliH/SctL family protein [[Clostridium] colinum]|uniref:FliH/SctL family protein n=1 Tax=[Clostridium] colinum TaxID=36835 RepID=UPI0020258511|nr:FliH/SctL family protein [[Clostridium] colinum]
MSRILKASYVNVEKNIVIDNTFSIEQENLKQDSKENVDESLEVENNNSVTNEEIIKQLEDTKQEIIEQANQEASEIIEQAKQEASIEAENILRQAQEEIDIKADEIYKENFDKGYQEGMLKAEQECQAMKEEAEKIVLQAQEERKETINNLESEIINFIVDTTQNILTKSFEFNPQIISLLIKKGLLSIKTLKNVKVYVSEQQYDYVEQNKETIFNTNTDKNNIEIIKDTSLKDTDCIIDTEIGSIQCGIDEQLSSIKEALYYILN